MLDQYKKVQDELDESVAETDKPIASIDKGLALVQRIILVIALIAVPIGLFVIGISRCQSIGSSVPTTSISEVAATVQPETITEVREINGDEFSAPVDLNGRYCPKFSSGIDDGLVVRINGTKIVDIPRGKMLPQFGSNINTLEFKAEHSGKSGYVYVYITQ